jgi:hypothetical protein
VTSQETCDLQRKDLRIFDFCPELLSEKGASRRNGPSANKSRMLEWYTVEFLNFVLSEMSILSNSFVNLAPPAQMIVAFHKGRETVCCLPELVRLR